MQTQNIFTLITLLVLLYLLWRVTRGPLAELMMSYIDKQHTLSHKLAEQANELCDDIVDHEKRIRELEAELKKIKSKVNDNTQGG